jgi:hypothetical protein
MSADRPDNGADTSWLTLDEAGQQLGLSKDALRKRIARGRLEARLGNDGTTRVLVTSATPPGPGLDGFGQVLDSPELVRLAVQLDDALERLEGTARDLMEARERAARAEGAAEALSGRVQDLSGVLSAERARGDRLEAALAEARRPWLAKVLEGLRRKGS